LPTSAIALDPSYKLKYISPAEFFAQPTSTVKFQSGDTDRFVMSKNRRLELIENIQEKRKSHVLAYVLSDRPNCEGRICPDAVREMYCLLYEMKPISKKPLDLFMFAHRGDTTVPWQMVGMIREMFDVFNVIIPYKAHGAATMVALGADTIIMGERGELSPIEVLVTGDDGFREQGWEQSRSVSVEDVTALVSLMELFGKVREKQRVDAFLRTMERVNPLLLGTMQKGIEQTKTDCLRLLEKRSRRFRKGKNKKIIKKLFSDFVFPHRYITRSEAVKSIGLKQVRREEALEPLFWELLTSYEQEFRTNESFCPEILLQQSNQDEMIFPSQKLAYLESAKGTRIFLEDIHVKKIREYPPTVQFDPQIVLPPLQIGAESMEEPVWSFIEGWLQNNLPTLIDQSFDRFKRSLPILRHQRVHLDPRWVDE
jgi:hypothetical protein